MKKTLKFIATLLCIAAMTGMWSCNSNQSSNGSNNNPTSSSSNPTNVSKSESVTPEKTSFTAANGRTYSFSEVEKKSYDWGTREGTIDKSAGVGYHYSGGTEKNFKSLWVPFYGIPESTEAKEAYNRALKKYIEGYDAGYKF